jgi:transcriptional regulator
VSENQVSTWHYEAVEIEGVARRISEEDLVGLLDQLSDTMEHRYSPDQPWTRAKMGPGKFEAMIKAIVGFEVRPTDMRGTRKFNQTKSGEDLAATIEGQRRAGREDIVAAIEEFSSHGE